MELPEIITPALIAYIKNGYQLRWDGLHGWSHWVRVCENGLRLARLNGADQAVVALFAFTHDMARQNDGSDHEHGPRAAEQIRSHLHGNYFQLAPKALKQLLKAVSLHTRGLQQASITVQTCWDADRLDLGRANIIPDPSRMCTEEARDPQTLEWAYQRSVEWLNARES